MTNVVTNSRSSKGGRTQSQIEHLDRRFGDLPIEDAEVSLQLYVSSADKKKVSSKARRKDPENCLLAEACKRQFDSTKVAFFKSVAYVEMPDEDGVRKVLRFILPTKTMVIIREFDSKGKARSGVTVVLNAPRGTKGLDAANAVRRRHQERKRKLVLEGVIEKADDPLPDSHRRGNLGNRGVIETEMDIRYGSGLVHHTVQEKK